jgi:3-hydroxy-9,10-secoandrosta-1,3,5(10)-triene-9,17-dione monooxygenase
VTTPHDQMIAAARQLAPVLAEHARAAEEARQPADAVIDAARASGLFEMMVPTRYGGLELDLDTFFETVLILGEADASAAWIIAFYIEHNWMLCQFPEAFQRELFASRTYVLAPAMLSPSGNARRVEGGYRLDGRWQWATGIVHADWVIAGAIDREGERPRALFFALPRDEVTVDDTWYMDGMSGTGSHDVLITDRFVSDERCVEIGAMLNAATAGGRLHDSPLFRTPMAPILSLTAGVPALGQARFVVREFARQLLGRYDQVTLAKQSENSSRQIRLARADMTVRAAEALLRDVLREVLDQRCNADEATRVGWTTAIAHAVGMCQSAINDVCEAAGASAHFLSNPLQRARRDVNTIACHTVFDLDLRYRSLGRTLLGMPSESTWH